MKLEDSRTRFTATSEAYRRFRPDYPEALFQWLLSLGPGRDAVDLGAGTGIATRQLAAHGFRVIGIEPNDAMRAAAQAEGGDYRSGESSATFLPDHGCDLVTAAQAFHWFPLAATLGEIARILRPGGHAVAFWNLRDATDPLVAAYTEVINRYSTEADKVPRFAETLLALQSARPGAVRRRFRHAQLLDRPGLHGRAWSSSYVAHGVADAAAFDAALDTVFDRFAVDGRVALAYRVEAVCWTC